jgi:hypothetical protein
MALTYGIDVHGTLAAKDVDGSQLQSSLFPLLRPLMAAWCSQGERVFIVSGPPADVIAREVRDLGLKQGIHYHAIISVVDFLRDRDVEMYEKPPGSNHWWCNEGMWWGAKAWISRIYKIDVLIDDLEQYERDLPEGASFVHVTAEVLNPDPDKMREAATISHEGPDGYGEGRVRESTTSPDRYEESVIPSVEASVPLDGNSGDQG